MEPGNEFALALVYRFPIMVSDPGLAQLLALAGDSAEPLAIAVTGAPDT